ncbi:MAG: potassium-transporting ATPase subunit KdpC [Chitinophagales bacterium]
MLRAVKNAFLLLLIMTVLTGIIYPLMVTGIAQIIFPRQADGITVKKGDETVGYQLIGQEFTSPKYFHSRPSASGYNSLSSGGSNLGPTNKELLRKVDQTAKTVRKENEMLSTDAVPADLVTSSGSGLDPHISPKSAYIQVNRVAKARNLSEDTVKNLVDDYTEGRQLGVLGEPRVNVLLLNARLDSIND